VLLTGAEGTPFSSGLFALDLKMPPTYPQSAPTAFFRTKIFHPNVDPGTGAICVDTLKRDWTPTLTLRDVLVTISCLLVFPNAASALNSEAGRLLEGDFGEFERKARLWARMHAAVPTSLKSVVEEARKRGDEKSGKEEQAKLKAKEARGKKRRETGDREEVAVFVREDGLAEVDDPFASTTTTTTGLPPFSTPEVSNGKMAALAGLGLAFKASTSIDDSSILMDLDTLSQQPPPIQQRKKHKPFPPEPQLSTSATIPSFSTVLSTPTPDQAISFTPNITTPRPPSPKRVRLSPEHELSKGSPGRAKRQALDETKSWITWFNASPTSPRESKKDRLVREKSEYKRLKAAGFSIKRYNGGRFGPRTGIERL
jgi:ubiquitin-conjugating enzyme E2 S